MIQRVQKELLNLAQGIHFCEIISKGNPYDHCESNMVMIYERATARLAKIVRHSGWPGIAMVGEDGSHAAYVIARGAANEPDLMRSFLSALSEAVHQGDASKIHEASLMDLIRHYEGKPQLLGLHIDWKENGQLGVEVDDIDRANRYRKELGLGTIQEASRKHVNQIEKQAPRDIKQYIEHINKWASRAGWRHAA